MKIPDLIIESETFLVSRLFDYYTHMIESENNNNNNKRIKKFSKLFNYISSKSIDISKLIPNYRKLVEQFCHTMHSTERLYVSIYIYIYI